MKVTLITDAERYFDVKSELRAMTVKERGLATLKAFLFWFSLALGSVFFPVVHFVLVPLFLILAIFGAIREWKKRDRLVILEECQCLCCRKEMKLPAALEAHHRIKCSHCFQHYKVSF